MYSMTFLLHMDRDFMWRWHCSDADRTIVVRSKQAYFTIEEARDALSEVKSRMIKAAAA